MTLDSRKDCSLDVGVRNVTRTRHCRRKSGLPRLVALVVARAERRIAQSIRRERERSVQQSIEDLRRSIEENRARMEREAQQSAKRKLNPSTPSFVPRNPGYLVPSSSSQRLSATQEVARPASRIANPVVREIPYIAKGVVYRNEAAYKEALKKAARDPRFIYDEDGNICGYA